MQLSTLNPLSLLYTIIDWRSWPTVVLYFPAIIYSFLYGVFSGSGVFLFALVNPKIPLGGFAGESKYDLMILLDKEVRPNTILIDKTCNSIQMLKQFKETGLSFPVVAKPNSHEGGFLVCKMNNEQELKSYHKSYAMDYLIQEYLEEPHEYSILFHKLDGHIELTSLTEKQPLSITGDGKSTIRQLLWRNPNVRSIISSVLAELSEVEHILEVDETFNVDFRANVDCGATILDRREFMDEELRQSVSKIMKPYPHFFYGRLDIKSKTLKDVITGNFKVMEVNGIKGEALHIYDRKFTIWQAYKEIFKHWSIILKLAKQNLEKGFKCPSIVQSINFMKQHRAMQLNTINKRYE
jgi:hypothetical protein